MEKYDAIIVGAGLSGLSCGYELSSRKKKVLILEKQPYPGGRTSSFTEDGMPVESGLHRHIGYYSALPRLLKKCGTPLNSIVTWEEKVDILIKGENKKLVLGLAPVFGPIKTLRGIFGNRDVLTAKDKLSMVPFFLSGLFSTLISERLDEVTVSEYANRRGVTDKAQRLVLEPFSTGIFFLPPENYSAYAFFGLFLPAVPKFYKMRMGAYLGGMSDVMCRPIAEKIRSLGGEVRCSEPVRQLMTAGGAVRGVITESGKEYQAEHTILAVPLPAAKSLLAPFKDNEELAGLFRLPTMSACTLQLELSRPAMPKDITCFGPGTNLISFAEQSRSTFRGSAGRLSVILGNPAEQIEKSTEELLQMVLSELKTLGIDITDCVLDARKVSEEDEFYSLTPGSQRLRPLQRTGIPGLVLAGDYTLTSSFATMEGAVISGRKAAKECLR